MNPRSLVLVVSLLLLGLGLLLYLRRKPRSRPVTYPPLSPADLPILKQPRNWTPTLESYRNLIILAIDAPAPCCLPIDPTFLPAILAWYQETKEDIAVHLRVVQPGNRRKMARVVVWFTEMPTGEHRAIRPEEV